MILTRLHLMYDYILCSMNLELLTANLHVSFFNFRPMPFRLDSTWSKRLACFSLLDPLTIMSFRYTLIDCMPVSVASIIIILLKIAGAPEMPNVSRVKLYSPLNVFIVRTAAVVSVTFSCWQAWHKSSVEKTVPLFRLASSTPVAGSG